MAGLDTEIADFKGLPISMKLVLLASIGLTLFSGATALFLIFASGYKLDPGLATFSGAFIGLTVVGWQTNKGFKNLVRSQKNQSELDRAARLHAAELEQAAEAAKELKERALLLSAIRAELVGLLSEAYNSRDVLITFSRLAGSLAAAHAPPIKQNMHFPSFNTPVYDANISKIGLLGVSLAGDVVKVMNRAKRKAVTTNDLPMDHKVAQGIYDTGADSYTRWASDIHHVAMRIRAIEEGWQDPGTLAQTSDAREKQTQTYDAPENRTPTTDPSVDPP